MYSAQHWPVAVNLRSSVQRVKAELSDLEFDADHEAVYGMERFFSEEQCLSLARKYATGVELCEDYLDKRLCKHCLLRKLKEVSLEEFANVIEEFIQDQDEEAVQICDFCGTA